MAATILVVDDEAAVRAYLRTILRLEGFQVVEGSDGQDAWEQLEQSQSAPDLLVTDIRMPRMDGIALARSVHQKFPGTPILYISGFPFDLEEQRTPNPKSLYAFLAKPFTRPSLLEAVRRCLSGGSAATTA